MSERINRAHGTERLSPGKLHQGNRSKSYVDGESIDTMAGRVIYDFTGETALVTGSTKGIGLGVATALAEAGSNVVINARSESAVERVADRLDATGPGNAIGVSADIAADGGVDRLVDRAIEAFGTVDLAVNNAAVWPRESSMLDADTADWDRTMNVNVRAAFRLSQRVGRHMREHGVEGSIVNVTSQTADRRTGGRGLYGVSKTAMTGLTWRMAHDLAAHGIRMNAVSTDVTESATLREEAGMEAADREDTTADDVLEEWGRARPLGRLGNPEDIADAVLYLASDRAVYVVGTVLRVSGGGNLQ